MLLYSKGVSYSTTEPQFETLAARVCPDIIDALSQKRLGLSLVVVSKVPLASKRSHTNTRRLKIHTYAA